MVFHQSTSYFSFLSLFDFDKIGVVKGLTYKCCWDFKVILVFKNLIVATAAEFRASTFFKDYFLPT